MNDKDSSLIKLLFTVIGLLVLVILLLLGWRITKFSLFGAEVVPPATSTSEIIPTEIIQPQQPSAPQQGEQPVVVPTATESYSVSTSTFQVYANLSWQNTGIQIRSGDRLRIIWDGQSKWRGTNSGDFSDPLGGWIDNTNPQFACIPLMSPDKAGWNALVAKIGDNGIVTNPFKEIPQGEGELKFAMNDCDSQRFDNEGSVVVTIEITR